MKPLLNFIFKWLVAGTLGNIAAYSLMLIALFMWDKRYMKMANDVMNMITINDNQNK
jgi:hypothetical protein